MANNLPLKLATIALFLAVEVVLMGGFTRITDSGLGCPDWPGCFGEMVMTTDTEMLTYLQERYPEIHVAAHKGWIEMIHRYIAGILGLLIVALAFVGYREKARTPNYPFLLSLTVLGLVIVQGAFGAFTVTLKLVPNIVTLHLMGGLIIVSTLMYLRHRLKRLVNGETSLIKIRGPVLVGVGLLFIQILLGGWVSTNYAGWACPSVLGCSMGTEVQYDFQSGFNFFPEVGLNYEGGRLEHGARAAIQMVHRAGAFVVLGYWIMLLTFYVRGKVLRLRQAYHFIGLVIVQIVFGYANVVYAVPDSLAFIHHALGVLLLFSAWSIAYATAVEQEDAIYGNVRHA
ncbi:MAG: heme A synthase [Gammaproteobacteria bacterium]|nr:heme A synthase [Gammaproteobacteria bacterium]